MCSQPVWLCYGVHTQSKVEWVCEHNYKEQSTCMELTVSIPREYQSRVHTSTERTRTPRKGRTVKTERGDERTKTTQRTGRTRRAERSNRMRRTKRTEKTGRTRRTEPREQGEPRELRKQGERGEPRELRKQGEWGEQRTKRTSTSKESQVHCEPALFGAGISSSIPKHYLDIGNEIERFVEECNVGADAWQRTGVLTFDGNRKVKKCTYKQIKKHLEKKLYGRHFARLYNCALLETVVGCQPGVTIG